MSGVDVVGVVGVVDVLGVADKVDVVGVIDELIWKNKNKNNYEINYLSSSATSAIKKIKIFLKN